MCKRSCKRARRLIWLNRDLLRNLGRKRLRRIGLWRQGQVVQKHYRNVVRDSRKRILTGKAPLELKLANKLVYNQKRESFSMLTEKGGLKKHWSVTSGDSSPHKYG